MIRTVFGFFSATGAAAPRWVRTIVGAGWPVLTGVFALVLGLLMVGAGAYLDYQARQLSESTTPVTSRSQSSNVLGLAGPDGIGLRVPAYDTHLDDISLLFRLASEQRVSIGPIDYRSEANPSIPVHVRLLDLRMNEEYAKLKAFVAELLERMPHVYLREIRVEQGNAASSSKVQATLGLSFVYQAAPPGNSPEGLDVGSFGRNLGVTPSGSAPSR